MLEFISIFIKIVNPEEGVTSIEYALIAALIAVVIFLAAAGVGINLNILFANVADQVGATITAAL